MVNSLNSDTLIAESYRRISIVLSLIPIFVLSDGAASNAARSFAFIVSFTFCVPLINGTFEAAKAMDCIDMSPSATYHKYTLIAASLLLQVPAVQPLSLRYAMYSKRKSCVHSSNLNFPMEIFFTSDRYFLNTVSPSW